MASSIQLSAPVNSPKAGTFHSDDSFLTAVSHLMPASGAPVTTEKGQVETHRTQSIHADANGVHSSDSGSSADPLMTQRLVIRKKENDPSEVGVFHGMLAVPLASVNAAQELKGDASLVTTEKSGKNEICLTAELGEIPGGPTPPEIVSVSTESASAEGPKSAPSRLPRSFMDEACSGTETQADDCCTQAGDAEVNGDRESLQVSFEAGAFDSAGVVTVNRTAKQPQHTTQNTTSDVGNGGPQSAEATADRMQLVLNSDTGAGTSTLESHDLARESLNTDALVKPITTPDTPDVQSLSSGQFHKRGEAHRVQNAEPQPPVKQEAPPLMHETKQGEGPRSSPEHLSPPAEQARAQIHAGTDAGTASTLEMGNVRELVRTAADEGGVTEPSQKQSKESSDPHGTSLDESTGMMFWDPNKFVHDSGAEDGFHKHSLEPALSTCVPDSPPFRQSGPRTDTEPATPQNDAVALRSEFSPARQERLAAMVREFSMLHMEHGDKHLKLQIPEVGNLEVRTTAGDLHAVLSVHDTEMQHALASNLPSLHEALDRRQVSTAQVVIGTFSSGTTGGDSQHHGHGEQPWQHRCQEMPVRLSSDEFEPGDEDHIYKSVGLSVHA